MLPAIITRARSVTGDTARCWGLNSLGQLGNGSTTNATTPVTMSGLSDALALAPGNNHTCVLTTSNLAQCVGRNISGQLGNGSTTAATSLVSVIQNQAAASLSTSSLTAGDHLVTAAFAGSSQHLASTSADLSVAVRNTQTISFTQRAMSPTASRPSR